MEHIVFCTFLIWLGGFICGLGISLFPDEDNHYPVDILDAIFTNAIWPAWAFWPLFFKD